jgi:hypothetical protein
MERYELERSVVVNPARRCDGDARENGFENAIGSVRFSFLV